MLRTISWIKPAIKIVLLSEQMHCKFFCVFTCHPFLSFHLNRVINYSKSKKEAKILNHRVNSRSLLSSSRSDHMFAASEIQNCKIIRKQNYLWWTMSAMEPCGQVTNKKIKQPSTKRSTAKMVQKIVAHGLIRWSGKISMEEVMSIDHKLKCWDTEAQ